MHKTYDYAIREAYANQAQKIVDKLRHKLQKSQKSEWFAMHT